MYPTKTEIEQLKSMKISDLKLFAKKYDVNLPSRTTKRDDIINIIKNRTKHPSNITIDNDINKECTIPHDYNAKVWTYELADARKDKQWALENIETFNDKYRGDMRNQMIIDGLEKSVCTIAKEKYDYLNMRSHAMGNMYGGSYPIDKPARDKWEELTTGKKPERKGLLDF